MLSTSLISLVLALAATSVRFVDAVAPEGFRTVYITSNVDVKFVVVPKTPVKGGTTLVVFVNPFSSLFFETSLLLWRREGGGKGGEEERGKGRSKAEQHWYIKEGNTAIQHVESGLCMDAGGKC
ncbi:hypothetical protein HYALB_00001827 [Hymenoscyphus albidus]|uniref:Uncharacterized protein n=1 Tax=Hymenoscyphus albidus TaxID=595503 RepID=A0A9N9LSW3_9HELO|nr:hypothetical protein HYALB_00001827 [Hymenoscyphus albidus]